MEYIENTVADETVQGRQQGIIDLLERHGAMSVAGLARRFHCSTATVRRDLVRIEESGVMLERHHGSVSLVREDLGTQFEAQRIAHFQAKEAVARLVVEFVPDHVTIGLNGGTTTTLVARALAKANKPVRVVTNAINIAYELALASMDVVVVGGAVQLPHFESTGKVALRTLADLHLDLAVLGVEGVDPAFGFSTAREEEAAIAEVFRASADEVMTVLDGSKLGEKALFRLLSWSEVNYVAIDEEGGEKLRQWPHVVLEAFRNQAQVWTVQWR
jgi:DeoR/GlpR family transcriptional regulator of sugar metabolism